MNDQAPSTNSSFLRRVGEGEAAAWNRLHKTYFDWLRDWAEQKGAIRQDAEDAASEVLLTLVEELPKFRYDKKRSFRGFLRHILRQRIDRINRLRRPVTNKETQMRAFLDGDAATEHVVDILVRKEDILKLASILPRAAKNFDEKVWQCWKMIVLEEKSTVEVAETLRVPIKNVYVYKSRVNKRIRELYLGAENE